ncbi:MAG: TonB-dependent receptor, partial [Candidatus Binatia bacterium]
LTASLAGTFGSFDENRLKAFVSSPLPLGFSFSAAGLYGRRDDYYDVHPASVVRSFPGEMQKGARVKLKWAPVDFFEATAAGQLLDTDGLGTALNAMLEPSPLSTALLVTAKGDRVAGVDVPPFQKNRSRVAHLTMALHPGWFDVKNIISYQEVRNRAQFDFDGSEMPIVGFYTTKPLFGDNFTEELQILSNENTPFSDWLEWIAGFYFIDDSSGFKRLDVTVGDLPQLTALGFPDLALPGVDNVTVGLVGILDTTSPAGFFQGTLKPLDWVDVTFGGRYLTERREIRRNSSFLDLNGTTTPLFVFPDRERNDSNFSPKAVLAVRPFDRFAPGIFDELMTYFSWAKGFKSGTYNILNITEAGDEVKSEEVTTYELGVKSTFLDGRVRANGALFRNEIEDLQSQFISLLSGGTTNLDNAGEASIEGFELEVIAGLLRDLYLNVGATYLDGVYDDFRNASGFDPQTGLFATSVDNTGNTIVRTPEWTVNAGLIYTLDVWRGVVEAGADVYYNSGYFFDTQNTAEQPSHWVTNARLGYLYEPWNLRVTGFGLNVNDADYYLTKFVQDFGVTGKLALPATYGVRIDWEF